MKKFLSLVMTCTVLCVMLLSVCQLSAAALEYYIGTNCTEQPDTGSVVVGNNGYFTQTTFTKFSEGEEASITIKVDEIGTDWSAAGVVLVVNSNLSATLPNTAWQSPGEDGIFTYCFKNGGSDNLLGAVYRWANGSSTTGAAAWINQPLSDKITFTIKNVNGVIAIYANDYKWAYTNSGYVIPDGYIGIATAANAKVTIHASTSTGTSTSEPEGPDTPDDPSSSDNGAYEVKGYMGSACTKNTNGSVTVGNNGYFTQTTFTKFSEGQEATITLSVDEMGSTWNDEGFALVVNSELSSTLPTDAWHQTGKDGVFAYAFYKATEKNPVELRGFIYYWGVDKNSQKWAGWLNTPFSGDENGNITFKVKSVDGVVTISANNSVWNYNTEVTIPDGYLGIVTAARAKVTIKESTSNGTPSTEPDEPNDPNQPNQPDEPDEPNEPNEPVEPPLTINASESYKGTACVANADKTVTLGNDGYYSQTKYTAFSKGESAKLVISVDEIGTDWYTSGLTILVNEHLVSDVENAVWQSTGADGIFAISLRDNNGQLEGVIYRYNTYQGVTAAATWARAPLGKDITIEIKNIDGQTSLFLNGSKWNPFANYAPKFSIPDGYLAITTGLKETKVTVKHSSSTGSGASATGNLTDVGYRADAQTVNADGSVTLGHNGYFSQAVKANFSTGGSAKLVISVDEIGTDWFTSGITVMVNENLVSKIAPAVWQSTGAEGVFAVSYAEKDNKMQGVIYRSEQYAGTTAAADWTKAPCDGDVVIEVKSDGSRVALYLNGVKWDAFYTYAPKFKIPDGYLAVATSANAKVTIKDSKVVPGAGGADADWSEPASTDYVTIAQPKTNIAGDIAMVRPIDSAAELDKALADKAAIPATMILNLNKDLNVLDAKGNIICDIDTAFEKLAYRVLATFRMEDTATADALAAYLAEKEFSDIYVMSADPSVVKYAREKMTEVRGVIDYTKTYADAKSLTKEQCAELRRSLWSNNGYVALLPAAVCQQETVQYLYDMQVNVWADAADSLSKQAAYELLLTGSFGVVSDDTAMLLDVACNELPANTVTRLPLNIAHKGLPTEYPENTLEGAIAAYEAGANTIELDVYLTTDGYLVISHDATTGRTCDKNLTIESSTLAQLKELNCNAGMDGVYRIPTLEEYLQYFQGKDCRFYIEINSGKDTAVSTLKALVEKYGMYAQCSVITSHTKQMECMRKDYPEMSLGIISRGKVYDDSADEDISGLLMPSIGKYNSTYNPDFGNHKGNVVRAMTLRGIGSYPFTFQTTLEYASYFLWGYGGLTGDHAEIMANWTKSFTVTNLKDGDVLPCGSALTLKALGTLYNRDSKDISEQTSFQILEGEELVKVDGNRLIAGDTKGYVTLILTHTYTISSGQSYSLSSQPITVHLTGGGTATPSPDTGVPFPWLAMVLLLLGGMIPLFGLSWHKLRKTS